MNEVKRPKKPLIFYYAVVLVVLLLLNFLTVPWLMQRQIHEVDYNTFLEMAENQELGQVEVQESENLLLFTNKDNTAIYKTGMLPDPDLAQTLKDSGATFSGEVIEQANPIISFLVSWVLPIIIFIAIGQFMSKKLMERAGGPNSLSFGKSNAKVYVKSSEGIRFSDVAGEDEAKENLTEIVDYLHNPNKYKEVGAAMPKGVLLVGPPGTGKTMLAKAVAGESNVPFFSMSGSEFVEMFVGMGAAKVRDLFKQAKEKAPCIVFIDEIDAIGQKRQNNVAGNDEREQTLNQLLTEMDGFEENSGVIILAATNRPESLDPALTRPGRFDRRVPVELPDLQGRESILRVHAKKVKIAGDVDFSKIARMAPALPARSWQTSSTRRRCVPCAPGGNLSPRPIWKRASRWSLLVTRRKTPSSPTKRNSSWPTTRRVTLWLPPYRTTPLPCKRSPSYLEPAVLWVTPCRWMRATTTF